MTESATSLGYDLGRNHVSLNPGDPNGNRYPGQGGARQPPSQHSQQVGSQGTGMTFACPFYRHNEEEHQECLDKKIERVCDVRLHIKRYHTQPSHCPRCGVTFPNDPSYSQRDEHLRSCRSDENPPPPPGMTPEQLRSMAKQRRRGSNDEERWLKIWDIMFPGQIRPQPESVYIDNATERHNREVRIGIEQYQQRGGIEQFHYRYARNVYIGDTLRYFLLDVWRAHHPSWRAHHPIWRANHPIWRAHHPVWRAHHPVALTHDPSLNGENYDNDVYHDGLDHLDNNQA
ncbi:hypothetical protein ANO14919_061820 [Xylariales sp. No.14919]|nr:hypothetical protein ANO14919_061820 [Xylariales sp. No.14919]